VGKGVTFDAGGISIKPSAGMADMKGDMGGAATVLASFWAAASQRLPLHLVAVMPLTENLLNGRATKPGDLVRARNGMTIEVDNTDAEGRLILADAIHYVGTEYPQLQAIVELSTLTGAMDVALGNCYAGVFSNSDALWHALEEGGKDAGDPLWRMPLDPRYREQMKSRVADICNIGGRGGGACTAAIFLAQFLAEKTTPFAHIDIAGVFHVAGTGPASGMTGRPTRAIIEYLRACAEAA
jgi:cytosol aminopeptidase